jgi:hypothetical protein
MHQNRSGGHSDLCLFSLEKLHTVFHYNCVNLHFYQQHIAFPFLHTYQQVILWFFNNNNPNRYSAIYLIIVLIWFSLMINGVVNLWSQVFLCWLLIASSISVFLLIPDWISAGSIFLGIYPFSLASPFCWHIITYSHPVWVVLFLKYLS